MGLVKKSVESYNLSDNKYQTVGSGFRVVLTGRPKNPDYGLEDGVPLATMCLCVCLNDGSKI